MGAAGIGVAVIGAGMAGRAHAAGYRAATTTYEPNLPPVRLVAVADLNEAAAQDAATRYGFDRAVDSWKAVADAPDVDVVSVVVANHLHREVVEGLLQAGKHVLCEKPFAPTIEDAEAMVAAARASGRETAIGFTFRRSPAINAVREQLESGALGNATHFNGFYHCDYAVPPQAPMSWRYKGGPGSGALADIGSHLVDLAEFLCGPLRSVRGAVMNTVVQERPLPLGHVVGHAVGAVSDVYEPVENEDMVTFTGSFRSGATATFDVSRVAFGHPNSIGFQLFGTEGTARFDGDRPAQFSQADKTSPQVTSGFRDVLLGPAHPYIARGFAMDFPGVGYGQNDFFVWQARSFLEQVAGVDGLPRTASFEHGLHNLRILEAVARSAASEGAEVAVP